MLWSLTMGILMGNDCLVSRDKYLQVLMTSNMNTFYFFSHICPTKVTEKEEKSGSCADFMTMTMQRYFLDKEQSFPGQTEEYIQSEITKYLNIYNKNLPPKTCYFYR